MFRTGEHCIDESCFPWSTWAIIAMFLIFSLFASVSPDDPRFQKRVSASGGMKRNLAIKARDSNNLAKRACLSEASPNTIATMSPGSGYELAD
jgi:hypothetical protein